MQRSLDWGVYEIDGGQVRFSLFIPGRPFNERDEPTRYRVRAEYRPVGDHPFCLSYVSVYIIPGRDRVTEKEKQLIREFVQREFLREEKVPIVFW